MALFHLWWQLYAYGRLCELVHGAVWFLGHWTDIIHQCTSWQLWLIVLLSVIVQSCSFECKTSDRPTQVLHTGAILFFFFFWSGCVLLFVPLELASDATFWTFYWFHLLVGKYNFTSLLLFVQSRISNNSFVNIRNTEHYWSFATALDLNAKKFAAADVVISILAWCIRSVKKFLYHFRHKYRMTEIWYEVYGAT